MDKKDIKKELAEVQLAIARAITIHLAANNEKMKDFAAETGISPSRLTSYRRGTYGKDPTPSLENLIRIKKGLGISYDELLGINDRENFNQNLTDALASSSTYKSNGAELELSKAQKETIKRIVFAYLNINDKDNLYGIEDYVNQLVDKKLGDDRG